MRRLLNISRLLAVVAFLSATALLSAAQQDKGSNSFSGWNTRPIEKPDITKFAWSAEFGSSVDLSGSDMSSIDIGASVGVSHKWIMLAGMGVGANIMISNSCRTYPLYAVFRTDFSSFLKIMFVEARGGIALNYLHNNQNQTDAYAGLYLGFNLARGKKFRSYITAGYTYIGRKDVVSNEVLTEYKPLSLASVRLGVTF